MKNSPLRIEVRDGELQIVIGVDTLAHALQTSPNFEDRQGPQLKVLDPEAFAKAVVDQLGQEDDVGETAVTDLLEMAAERAIEDGEPSCEWRESV